MRASPFFLLCAALALGCGADDGHGPDGDRPAPVVETIVLELEHIENVARFVGQLETAESVLIKPEISGVAEEVLFTEGEPVKRGTPLVRLRDAEQLALLAAAQAEVTLRKDAFERSKRLAKSDARSEAELVRIRGEYEIANARLDLARVQLERTVIRAPFDGVVGSRLVSTGERVSPGGSDRFAGNEATGITRIESLDRMELVFTVPETIASAAAMGLDVRVSVASYPDQIFPGKVFFVGPRVNSQNRRVPVKAAIPNPDHLLKPGMFTRVEMRLAELDDGLMVPEGAVVFDGSGSSVWRVRPDRIAESVSVQLGQRQDGRVHVMSGLRGGDEVVVSGTHKVVDGEPVDAIRIEGGAPLAGAPRSEALPKTVRPDSPASEVPSPHDPEGQGT